MVFHKYIPDGLPGNYIDCMVYIEGNNKGTGFPKTAMSLVFNLHDSFKLYASNRFAQYTEYKKYWVAGLQTQPSYVESYGESKMLVIQFKTLGAYAVLKQPLRHFANSYIYLDCVLNREAEEIWGQLKEAEGPAAMFRIAEQWLNRKVQYLQHSNEGLLTALCNQLTRPAKIADVCSQFNISRKHLNFLFGEYLGVSPKMIASLHRFQRILHSISRSRPDKLTDIAYELDFFDQAHFNNNFKKFTGLKPYDYIRNVETTPSLKLVPHFLPAGR